MTDIDRSRIGPFALEERLGPTRKGSVFRGFHVQQRRGAAVRIFSAPLVAHSDRAREEFSRDLRPYTQVRHKNVARVYGVGFDGMEGFIASELISGESLGDVLRRRNRLPWEMMVDYGLQMAEGLKAIHEAGLIHERVHPDKVIITEGGVLKIVDLRPRETSETTAERRLERLSFFAPELLLKVPAPTIRTDLYGLGCLLYLSLSGDFPHTATTRRELREAKQQTPPRVAATVLDCPVWLDALVSQLLEPEPQNRPYTAGAVSLALQETKRKVAERTGVVEHAARGFSPLQVKVGRDEANKVLGRKKRRDAGEPFYESPWMLAGCLFLLVAAILTWALWPASEEKLFARAEALMEKDNAVAWRRAQDDYLEPLLEKFPEGEYAERAREYIDLIEMDRAERRLRRSIQFNRELDSEGARLYAEALQFERFGDHFTALEKYHSLVNLLDENGPDRPFINLARRQIESLEAITAESDRLEFVREKLENADTLALSGEVLQAREMWRSIVSLYGNNREFASVVQEAEQRLVDGVPDDPEPDGDDSEPRAADDEQAPSTEGNDGSSSGEAS